MIEIFLSSDGKNTVHVQASTVEEMDKQLPYTERLFRSILEKFGTKAEMWKSQNGEEKHDRVSQKVSGDKICQLHQVILVERQGIYGKFFACPSRDQNGNWCSTKIPEKGVNNGHGYQKSQTTNAY